MKRSLQNDRPPAERIEHIEISEKRIKLRTVLLILTATIALVSFAYGISTLLTHKPGIREITVLPTGDFNCGDDFKFYYNLGAGDSSATAEQKAVRALYSKAAIDAYRLFSADMRFEDCNNLWYINEHVNQEITVDPALYNAFSLLGQSGERYLYLAPMYEIYLSLFQCEYDHDAAEYDPFLNAAISAFFAETVAFTNNPGEIELELLGNNIIRLNVSDNYLRFARENKISRLIDFFWMKNAFIIDYISDILLASGYSHGALISCDGFARNLDNEPQTEFTYTLYRRDAATISGLQTLHFSNAVSIVYMRDYPLGNGDEASYYVREDGTIRFPFIDAADGLCKSAVPEIAASSAAMRCAEIALKLAPVYISGTLDDAALRAITREGITIYTAHEY